MAEHKTYSCDYPGCGTLGATHLRVPDVDSSPDPAGGKAQWHDGNVDLCAEHMQWIITCAIKTFEPTLEKRRQFWRMLLKKQ